MTSERELRVRMAPSPTGFVHVGTLRTVLYDALFAQKNGGKLVLRIEDTDQSRKVEGSVENLLEVLAWAGILHDEGPVIENGTITEKGGYGPYTQSKRLEIYKEHVNLLLEKGHAYHCFCTSERLDEMRALQQKMKQPPMYDRTCAQLNSEDVNKRIAAGEKYVVRMRVPRGEEVVVDDLVRGKVVFQTDTIDDQVIMKSDGYPTYHLAVVVDDHLMNISHVIRGEEWLPSTPKHIILYNMFGWPLPQFAHLPLLLNPDKSKLSKRQGDVAVEDYRAKGYLPQALVNFVAFLGWHPGKGEEREIFSYDELVDKFDFSGVHKSGAIFDIDKLNKVNSHYIKQLSLEDLYAITKSFFENKKYYADMDVEHRDDMMRRVLAVEQDRLHVLSAVGDDNPFFFEEPVVESEFLRWKKNTDKQTIEALTKAQSILMAHPEEWTRENLESVLMEAAGEKRGDFLWPLRAALTGAKFSPSPIDCAWVLGREKALKRIQKALELF